MNLEQKESSEIERNLLPVFKKGVPLPLVLVVPFVLQIFAAVGITGYLSFRNGQKAVNDLATHLQEEVSDRVSLHLDNYLATARNIAQTNASAIELGLIDIYDYQTSGCYLWQQIQILYQDVGYIDYALPTGEYVGAGRWLENGGTTIDELSADTQWKANTYSTNPKGNRIKVIDDTDYAPLEESWYREVVKAQKPVWNEIYAWDGFPDILSIAMSHPVYDRDDNLIAVAGVDLLLRGINDFLRQIEVSPSAIASLLAQIPDEHTLLAQALQNKVSDFDFDDIVDLIGQTAKIRINNDE